LEPVIKICQEIRNFVTIGQKYQELCKKTWVQLIVLGDIKSPQKALSWSEMVSGYHESRQRYKNYANAPHCYFTKHCLSWSSWYWSTFQITAS